VTTRKPAKVPLTLVIVLALVTLLATAFVVIAVAGSQFTTDVDGATREVGLAERVSDNPARFLLPLALALAAGAAGLGSVGGRPWAPSVALTVGIAILLIGAFLLYQAAREWGMEGSFSPLLVPPGVVCLGVGAYIVLAARNARRDLAIRA
jgi:hypothetical protein